MTLTAILATRGRPQLLIQTLEQTLSSVALRETRIVVAIDHDDDATIKAVAAFGDKRVLPDVRQREDSLGEKYNNRLAVAPADVYLVMVDYAPHVTFGFDKKILQAASLFPDGIGVVYNHMANASFPQINAVTHRLTELMGGIYPAYFPYWFVDHWLDEIARMIDRIACADVWLDCSARPGTMEAREPYWWAAFFDVLAPMRRAMALSIMDAPDFAEPAWRKRMLVSRFPLIEEVSQIINDTVRDAPWAKGSGDHDARYLRIKARAVEIARCYVDASRKAEADAEALQPRFEAGVAA